MDDEAEAGTRALPVTPQRPRVTGFSTLFRTEDGTEVNESRSVTGLGTTKAEVCSRIKNTSQERRIFQLEYMTVITTIYTT